MLSTPITLPLGLILFFVVAVVWAGIGAVSKINLLKLRSDYYYDQYRNYLQAYTIECNKGK